jgi:hypothetical protein
MWGSGRAPFCGDRAGGTAGEHAVCPAGCVGSGCAGAAARWPAARNPLLRSRRPAAGGARQANRLRAEREFIFLGQRGLKREYIQAPVAGKCVASHTQAIACLLEAPRARGQQRRPPPRAAHAGRLQARGGGAPADGGQGMGRRLGRPRCDMNALLLEGERSSFGGSGGAPQGPADAARRRHAARAAWAEAQRLRRAPAGGRGVGARSRATEGAAGRGATRHSPRHKHNGSRCARWAARAAAAAARRWRLR